jgi:hypothetical protein
MLKTISVSFAVALLGTVQAHANGRGSVECGGFGVGVIQFVNAVASQLNPNEMPNTTEAQLHLIRQVDAALNERNKMRMRQHQDAVRLSYNGRVHPMAIPMPPDGPDFQFPGMSSTTYNAFSKSFRNSEIQCFPGFVAFLNKVHASVEAREVAAAQRQAAEAQRLAEENRLRREREAAEAKQRAERQAEENKQRAEYEAQMAEIRRNEAEQQRQRELVETQKRLEREAEEVKQRAEHERELARIWQQQVHTMWGVSAQRGEKTPDELFIAVNREVGIDCAKNIRKLVRYDIRSPGIVYGKNSGEAAILRFTKFSARVSEKGTISLYGDDAEAQNGFGNWLRVNYSCEINLANKHIVDVKMDFGMLN